MRWDTLVTKGASVLGLGLCRFRGRQLADGLERAVDRFHRRLNNTDFVMHRNGELRVLRTVMQDARCVFDVGANVGEWTLEAAALAPECTIHAFEIVPLTYETLRARTASKPKIRVNNLGLSATGEPVTIHLGETSDTATACRLESAPLHQEYYSAQIRCTTCRAEDYMREQGIDEVDFVKIDVEGMDLQVIKGFGERLRHVRALQFEYGIFNIASRDLLHDFYQHLQQRGFLVGKIFPAHVVFSDYHFNMENFHGSNYVAVREDQRELIQALQ